MSAHPLGDYVFRSDREGLTPDSIESHIAKIQAALDIAKTDLKTGTDPLSLARKIQVLKALIDELGVMQQIKEKMSISSSIDGQIPNQLP